MNTFKHVLALIEPVSLPRLEGISRFAREHRWNLLLGDRLTRSVNDWTGDGVLVTLRRGSPLIGVVRSLRRRGIPVVDMTIECPGVRLPRVISDHAAIGRIAGEHFLQRGFLHLAWFSSNWTEVHRLRYAGFAAVCDARPARLTQTTLRTRLVKLPNPCGVLAYNDSDAALVLDAARNQGLSTPEDVSVLGIGDDPFLCENQPIGISSVAQDLAGGAYRAAELLQRLMDGATPPAAAALIPPGNVTLRASTDTLAHNNPIVRAALVYIHRSLSHAFGAAEVAESIGLTRPRLDHLFADKVGHSVGREILRQRLLRVKHLLKDPSLGIGEIAAACGFCNVGYLTNTFHRETGLTPTLWRQSVT